MRPYLPILVITPSLRVWWTLVFPSLVALINVLCCTHLVGWKIISMVMLHCSSSPGVPSWRVGNWIIQKACTLIYSLKQYYQSAYSSAITIRLRYRQWQNFTSNFGLTLDLWLCIIICFYQLPVNSLRPIINFINACRPCDDQVVTGWDSPVRMGGVLSIRGDTGISQIAILSETVAFWT